jgi:hypothetical protein
MESPYFHQSESFVEIITDLDHVANCPLWFHHAPLNSFHLPLGHHKKKPHYYFLIYDFFLAHLRAWTLFPCGHNFNHNGCQKVQLEEKIHDINDKKML